MEKDTEKIVGKIIDMGFQEVYDNSKRQSLRSIKRKKQRLKQSLKVIKYMIIFNKLMFMDKQTKKKIKSSHEG